MEENGEKNTSDKPASLLSYLPYVLGFLGIVFIVLGFVLGRDKTNKKEEEIVISEEADAQDVNKETKIFLDIEGAVEKPGVYEMKSDSRMRDLLTLSGGLSSEADRDWVEKNINLAIKLVDGTKVYIPKIGENIGQVQSANNNTNTLTQNENININTASLSQLDTLSGIGPVTGQKIIDNRPYQRIEELIEKKIVGNSVWEKIKDKVSVY